jgi:3-mercaptopropionate dioxygenase
MGAGNFFVQHPAVHRFIAEVESLLQRKEEPAMRLAGLRAPYRLLLEDQTWLPEEFRRVNPNSAMGGGIASWLLYQSAEKDLSLFSLVVPPGVTSPIHNHLAWGLVGIYAGEQEEEEFEPPEHRHDPSAESSVMELRFRRVLKRGDFYELIPPYNDVHRVKTISSEPSISLHLLANDTGCIVRQKFDLASGEATPFRSGWSNQPCPEGS